MLVRSFGEGLVRQRKLEERRKPNIAISPKLLAKVADNGSLNH